MNFKPTNKIQIRTKLISANMYKTDNDNNNISIIGNRMIVFYALHANDATRFIHS